MKRFEEFALIAGSPHVDDGFARLLTDPSSFTEDVRETINGMPERYRATYLCPMLIEDPAALEASDKIAAHYGLPPLRLSPKADARMWLRGAFRDMLHWNAELRTLLNEAGPQGERRNECIGRLEEVLKTGQSDFMIPDSCAASILWFAGGESGVGSFVWGSESDFNSAVSDPTRFCIPLYKFTEADGMNRFRVDTDLRFIPTCQVWMNEALES